MSLRRRPVGPEGYTTELRCDRCGQPAEWRHRVTSACCMYGEALCDNCENRYLSARLGQDTYWADLRDDLFWFVGKLPARLRRFNKGSSTPGRDKSGRTAGREAGSRG